MIVVIERDEKEKKTRKGEIGKRARRWSSTEIKP